MTDALLIMTPAFCLQVREASHPGHHGHGPGRHHGRGAWQVRGNVRGLLERYARHVHLQGRRQVGSNNYVYSFSLHENCL